MKETRSEGSTTLKAMLAIVVIIFIAAVLIMYGLLYLGTQNNTDFILLVGILTAVITAPPIYWLVLSPIRQEYITRLRGEGNNDDLSLMAITDPLTHIMNRRGITVGLLDAMAQAERYRTPLTVAMADIDLLKEINASYGRGGGDRVLKDAAGVMADALRMPDKLGRYGGEEFLIVLPHTSLVQGKKIVERIRSSVSKWDFDVGSKKIRLTISIGVTHYKIGEDLEQLMSHASKALQQAKQGGRNKVVASKDR
ncbi:MAG: GGDEF domain-containing protein [Sulfuricaulis sp.]|nr:GGDEF domain-containing protein [Sulfuricaulis sp.]